MPEIKLSELTGTLRDELDYPIDTEAAAEALDDYTLLLADGEEQLSTLIHDLESEEYGSVGDTEMELYSHLPPEALGEPGQSEGDA